MTLKAYNPTDFMAYSLGQSGATLFADTTARTGAWFAITILADVVFTTLTDATLDGTAIAGVTFSAGSTIYGNFTAITLASGTAIAYKVGD
jgi:hypothetical protein